MVTRDWGLVIGEWGPAPRIRGTRLHVVAGRAYARIGDWENFYSRRVRKGREAPTGAPTESGQVRGRDTCARIGEWWRQ